MKVSVIVPSFNSKKYLRQCIDSIMRQTIDEMEIICVDAGSSDGTIEILNEYADKNENFRIIHSDRRSMGFQYNLGLRVSTGEYIGFVETDDFVEDDMYKCLYETGKKYDIDMVRADWYAFQNDKNSQINVVDRDLYHKALSFTPINAFSKSGDIGHWSGIYKRDYLIHNQIFFNETEGASYQDLGFYFLAYASGGSSYFLNKPLYHYRKDNKESSVKDVQKTFFVFEEFDYVYNKLRDCNSIDYYKGTIASFFYSRFLWALRITPMEKQLEFIKRFSIVYGSLFKEGDSFDGLFTEEEMHFLNNIICRPEHYLYEHRRKQAEYFDSLSTVPNLIVVGKGMVASWIIKELKDTSNIIANITSENLDKYYDYTESGNVLIAVKNMKTKNDIMIKVKEYGYKNYMTIPYGLFDF